MNGKFVYAHEFNKKTTLSALTQILVADKQLVAKTLNTIFTHKPLNSKIESLLVTKHAIADYVEFK